MIALTPGLSEAVWCTANANFLAQVIALAFGVALIQTMWKRIKKLTGVKYDDPDSPQTPGAAVSFSDTVNQAKSNRLRRLLARLAAIFTLACTGGVFISWVAVNLIVDGNTKCGDLHGRFAGDGPNWTTGFVSFACLALVCRILFELAAKGLPE